MSWRIALGAVWALGLLLPAVWWLRNRRRVDVWRALPVPAVLVDRAGRVRATTGPGPAPEPPAGPLPAAGVVARQPGPDGTPLAVSGVRGGALVVRLPGDPLAAARERLLAGLAPRLAHEVATPLTAVRGHLDLVAHEPVGPVAARSLAIAVAEVDRVVALARDLLSVTTVRSGTTPPTVELAGALAEEAVTGLLPLADELGARLSVETGPDPLRVRVVAGDLIRALRNLVHNALRHGLGERRDVVVAVLPAAPDLVRFEVRDSGPGLEPGELERWCEPLARGGESAGSGLGLAIVREVLAEHATALRAGPAPDGGLVWFDLPRAGAPAGRPVG